MALWVQVKEDHNYDDELRNLTKGPGSERLSQVLVSPAAAMQVENLPAEVEVETVCHNLLK